MLRVFDNFLNFLHNYFILLSILFNQFREYAIHFLTNSQRIHYSYLFLKSAILPTGIDFCFIILFIFSINSGLNSGSSNSTNLWTTNSIASPLSLRPFLAFTTFRTLFVSSSNVTSACTILVHLSSNKLHLFINFSPTLNSLG